MQQDMHYDGTYMLARAAGLAPECAVLVATASQYVDDSTNRCTDPTGEARIQVEITSHHPEDCKANVDPDDQRQVWVPFHFLPGGEGGGLTDKLVCRCNTPIAADLVDCAVGNDSTFRRELLGVTAHVIADTYSHWGFAGVSSRRNRVKGRTIKVLSGSDPIRDELAEHLGSFFTHFGPQGGLLRNIRNVISGAAEKVTGALGHGAVATYPDLPFLEWAFTYEKAEVHPEGVDERRSNRTWFLRGSEALHDMFRRFAASHRGLTDGTGGVPFDDLRPHVDAILRVEGDTPTRAAAWRAAMEGDTLFRRVNGERLPDYDWRFWQRQAEALEGLEDGTSATTVPVFRFFQAASHLRQVTLREVLPAHGVVVV